METRAGPRTAAVDAPAVSVIIPTYRRPALLEIAMRSVLAQTCADYELIVADDGSGDDTEATVRGFADPRIRYLGLPHRGLPAASRNAAMKVARGRYYAFLDDDDEWLPQKLEKQVAEAQRHPEAGLICTNALYRSDPPGASWPAFTGVPAQHRRFRGSAIGLARGNYVVCSSVLLRADLIADVGAFSEESGLRGVEDYDLWMRVAAVAGIVFLADILVHYRVAQSAGLTALTSRRAHRRALALVGRNHIAFSRARGIRHGGVYFARQLARRDVEQAKAAWRRGHHAQAAGWLLRSLGQRAWSGLLRLGPG